MRSNLGLKDFILTFNFPHNRTCQFKLALKITKEVKQIQVISGIKMNLIDNLISRVTLIELSTAHGVPGRCQAEHGT